MKWYPYYMRIAYIILFIALSIGGMVFSSTMQYRGISQFECNFIFGMIISLYAMENLVLFSDLKKCNEMLYFDY